MLKLKAHTKPISPQTNIDKHLLIPKKLWDDFKTGETELKLNGKKIKTRIYDIPCDCVNESHYHRIIDLRNSWGDLKASEGKEISVEK